MDKSSIMWILDSCLQFHICKNFDDLTEGKYQEEPERIDNIFYGPLDSHGIGEGKINLEISGQYITLKNVKIVPEMKNNIISISQLIQEGYQLTFEEETCLLEKSEHPSIIAKHTEQGYEILTINKEKFNNNTNTHELYNSMEEPDDWNDVINRPKEEQEIWIQAMSEELNNMEKNNVWTIEKPPQNIKPITCRWTFSLKRNHVGEITKLRARLVARGCGQVYGMNYTETYAPVIKHETIRTVMTIAGSKKLESSHCDINSAFLYGKLEDIIYMKGPPGPWKNISQNIYRLKRSIYGLKQAARIWNSRIDKSLKNCEFLQSNADPCLYINSETYVLIHVDDLLLIGPDLDIINRTIKSLSNEYEIKELGPVRCYLGINMEWDPTNTSYYLHQNPKIEKLLNQLNITQHAKQYTPMEPGFLKGTFHSTSPPLENITQFQQLVGSLMYLGLVSRPDIHLASNLLGRRAATPTISDLNAARRVIKHLGGTMNLKLRLGGKSTLTVKSYCDADWGGDLESRRSTSGQIHYIGDSAVSWRSKRQTCIAQSTAEAEYVAAAICTQEIIWLHRLMEDLGLPPQLPTLIYSDSLSGINMASSYKMSNRTKHIDLKYHFLRNYVEKEIVTMEYVPTTEQTGDIFTKPLPRDLFIHHRISLGLNCRDDISKRTIFDGD